MKEYDFSGWATRANLKCSDGRTIMKDAFKDQDGHTVPLVWNHQHNSPLNVLGHALLESRNGDMYSYCKFNNSESGQAAKEAVLNGDVEALSIHANRLKQDRGNVLHGCIREVSLVLAGANPGARIDYILNHSDDSEANAEEAYIFGGDGEIEINHAKQDEEEEDKTKKPQETEEKKEVTEEDQETKEKDKKEETLETNEKKEVTTEETEEDEKKKDVKHSDEPQKEDVKNPKDEEPENKEKTLQDIYDSLSDEQKNAVATIVALATVDTDDKNNQNKEGEETEMKQNVFSKDNTNTANTLSHADQEKIINLAKQSNVGSFKVAMEIYAEENSLKHGIVEGDEGLNMLFPDYKNINPGAPEIIRQDQSWVMSVINKIHKSPFSRIRTRMADARIAELRAKGYQKKGDEKTLSANIKMLGRTTDPQTVYRKDELNRDDIIDITDFDVVGFQWGIMKDNMYEELALAALVGDGRQDGDPDKIHEEHIRSIWNDKELYTIHKDVDIAAAKKELQGTNTGANFGENYIYAEAIITAALYAREQYKGSGKPDLYCTPHLVNVMLLARDLNGRRIYDSKADLAKALNVGEIHEIEQFEGKTRTTEAGEKKKLLGLFVNLVDYTYGSTKGGELTKFDDFDIDFNRYKYLLETRLSGALTKIKSAIALEEPVVETVTPDQSTDGTEDVE